MRNDILAIIEGRPFGVYGDAVGTMVSGYYNVILSVSDSHSQQPKYQIIENVAKPLTLNCEI